MLYAVITTIAEPTACVRRLLNRLEGIGGRLVVAGTAKGRVDSRSPTVRFSHFVRRRRGQKKRSGISDELWAKTSR